MQLTIRGLSKTYSNGVQALKKIDLTVYQGMFGLLGPNGAGKSTLMKILATLLEADSGSIELGDLDLITQKREIRKTLGYLPQEFGLYPKISAGELLDHFACLKGLTNKAERKAQVEYMLERTNLWEHRKKKLGTFSGGMKQRFGIAQALLANPQLVIVDEPTAGLDPTERYRLLNLLSELAENTIVILSTHIVDDVKELCTHIALIHDGRVLYKGRPSEALELFQGKIWKKKIEKAELPLMKEQHNVISERLLAGKPVIHVYSEKLPGPSFEEVDVEIEHAYFSFLSTAETHPNAVQASTISL